MVNKLRQISDTIHQTVYLSELESSLMSTAYFYRLHDVYQSSTVYLTFPCNRTKRYEHSYGTMELAGEMFFSAITNADKDVLNEFFSSAEKYLTEAIKTLLSGNVYPTYCNSSYRNLSQCFKSIKKSNLNNILEDTVSKAYKNVNLISDAALDHYMPPFFTELNKRKFLYQCLLESVRIVALFHDIGHPPYSHIMEKVLNDLYKECLENTSLNCERANELLDNLKPFKEAKSDNITCLLSEPQKISPELHEQVGLKMLASAFDNIFNSKFDSVIKKKCSIDEKSTIAIYYVALVEFCFAILREKTPFFISLHRIIDGCIDCDRMDYIVRDSQNSGVNWGNIPYKRLIESCKLFRRNYNNEIYYSIAFQHKMEEHIDDLLIIRYKIFSRINYHHRSYKTALILQNLVVFLAKDYLKKNDSQKSLCPGISDLWNCLSSTMNSGDLYIIQWNDSTLISHLYQTLAEVKNSSCDVYDISEKEFCEISNMLEEFLLNRKHFYSVFKRQSDLAPILSDALNPLKPKLDQIEKHEENLLKNTNDLEKIKRANESLMRLAGLKDIIQSGDSDALSKILPTKSSLRTIIIAVLDKYKNENRIYSYLFDENTKRFKTGLPYREDYSDMIYLYESNHNKLIPYNGDVLQDQLINLQKHCLQYIAYVEPNLNDPSENIENIILDIRAEISKQLETNINRTIDELFSN